MNAPDARTDFVWESKELVVSSFENSGRWRACITLVSHGVAVHAVMLVAYRPPVGCEFAKSIDEARTALDEHIGMLGEGLQHVGGHSSRSPPITSGSGCFSGTVASKAIGPRSRT